MTTSTSLERRPLVPEDQHYRPRDAIYRLATAEFLHAAASRDHSIDAVLARHWPQDRVAPLVQKAATAPATTTTSGWASQLAVASVADFFIGLTGLSAAAELIRRGLKLSLSGYGSATVPRRIVVADDAGAFVAEGSPIQVRSLALTAGPTLQPSKFAVIASFAEELGRHAVQSIENVVRQVLSEAAALALDAALFSTTAGSAIRPAGLLNGLSPITASSATPLVEAMMEDIEALSDALAGAGGGTSPVIIANLRQATALALRAGAKFDIPVLSSVSVTAGQVIMVDAASFVSAFDSTPQFDTTNEASIHEEDTTPLAIGTAGSPATVAAPVRSLWQTNCVSVRAITRTAWGLRAPHAAFVDSVTW